MSMAPRNNYARAERPDDYAGKRYRGRARFDPSAGCNPPSVQLVGDTLHPDFDAVVELLRKESRLVASANLQPDVILMAQSRPDTFSNCELVQLQQTAPLAATVALLGSWCEGEMRSGRPLPAALRIFWYEFPSWWKRQMSLRRAGRCPDWARRTAHDVRLAAPDATANSASQSLPRPSLVVVKTSNYATGNALADVLHSAGYSVAIQTAGSHASVRGALAAVWDGGQLSDHEAVELKAFSAEMDRHAAPVLVLLDFPRRDRIDAAVECGAAGVLGKPWFNGDLIAAVEASIRSRKRMRAA